MWMKQFQICLIVLTRGSHRHFQKVEKVSYRVFSENYSPLKELLVTPRRDDITKEKWMRFSKILKRMTSNGKLLGWCPTRSYIDVGTSTGSLYLEFGELLGIPICSY
ncbi:hypothetical protein Goshw_023276 [Gossypium schwendimanii]|uniref:Methyltransferase n=1 Tax=Gossypium schwendimanii TaxID=34291 RepID=A0A7J9N6A8_GOSSC|nr:hypothetical protein [Gossypium schwendimanii]